MKLNRHLRNAVDFARWCSNNEVEPMVAAELIAMAQTAATASAWNANVGKNYDRLRRARGRFEDAAHRAGFHGIKWGSGWPTLVKRHGPYGGPFTYDEVTLPDLRERFR